MYFAIVSILEIEHESLFTDSVNLQQNSRAKT
jgi:hypothetical protein